MLNIENLKAICIISKPPLMSINGIRIWTIQHAASECGQSFHLHSQIRNGDGQKFTSESEGNESPPSSPAEISDLFNVSTIHLENTDENLIIFRWKKTQQDIHPQLSIRRLEQDFLYFWWSDQIWLKLNYYYESLSWPNMRLWICSRTNWCAVDSFIIYKYRLVLLKKDIFF